MQKELTHLDEHGHASMVDVSTKPAVRREAIAEGFFHAAPGTLDQLEAGTLPKGEAMAVSRLAGIQAAKDCARIVPLCHPLPIEHVAVEIDRVEPGRMRIRASVVVIARTGVEMEALAAVMGTALSLWDMSKAIDDSLLIDGVHLVEKRKGAS